MGEGGGASIHAICAAIQDALRGVGGGIVTDSHNPPSGSAGCSSSRTRAAAASAVTPR